MGVLLLCGCSTGVGLAGNHVVHAPRVPSLGLQATSLVNLAVFSGPAISFGLDAQVLERLDHDGDGFSQWRLRTLIGVSQQPQPSEFFIGYEAFLAPALGRIYVSEARPLDLRGGLGVQLGAPIRLASPRPPWRSDDLAALSAYVVPWISGSWFYEDTLDVGAGLSLRLSLWTAVLP